MNKLLLTAVLAATTGLSAVAEAKKDPFADADAAIQYRQKLFSVMAANMGDIGAALKGKKEFSNEVVQRRADAVYALSLMPLEAFQVQGSADGETEAKADIWSDFADFEQKMLSLQDASGELAKVAATGDAKQIGTAFKATYKSCKGCHDSYKKD